MGLLSWTQLFVILSLLVPLNSCQVSCKAIQRLIPLCHTTRWWLYWLLVLQPSVWYYPTLKNGTGGQDPQTHKTYLGQMQLYTWFDCSYTIRILKIILTSQAFTVGTYHTPYLDMRLIYTNALLAIVECFSQFPRLCSMFRSSGIICPFLFYS